MKIETKFNPRDKVWIAYYPPSSNRHMALEATIHQIAVHTYEDEVIIEYYLYGHGTDSFVESDVFETKEELIKSL